MIVVVLNPFVYAEDELSLGGVIDGDGGPFRHIILVVDEGTGINFLEFTADGCAFDHLFDAGGNNVVVDGQAKRFAVGIDCIKPCFNTFIERNAFSVVVERLPGRLCFSCRRPVDHQHHIGKNGIGMVRPCNRPGFLPEILCRSAQRIKEIILLHIAGG